MRKTHSRKVAWAALLTGATVAGVAFAGAPVSLIPNGVAYMEGTTVTETPWLAGTTIGHDVFEFDCSAPGSVFKGKLEVTAVQNAHLKVDLLSRLQLDPANTDAVVKVDTSSFGGSTRVEYRTDLGGDLGPKKATRKPKNVVTFDFHDGLGPVQPGDTTYPFFVSTDAPSFSDTGTTVLTTDTGVTCTITGTYEPS